MEILLLGAGAIGCLVAPLFSANPANQLLLYEQDPLKVEAIKAHGIVLQGKEETILHKVQITNALPKKPQDLIVIATKTTSNAKVYPALKPLIGLNTMLMPLQNGWGNCQALGDLYGRSKILGCAVYFGGFQTKDYVVHYENQGNLLIGSFSQEYQEKARETFATLWQDEYEPKVKVGKMCFSQNVELAIWQKLIINSVINPITAYFQIKNGQVLAEPYKHLAQKLLQEAMAVSQSLGYAYTFAAAWDNLTQTIAKTQNNYSSMYMDIVGGKQPELEGINQVIINKGKEQGIGVLEQEKIVALLRQKMGIK